MPSIWGYCLVASASNKEAVVRLKTLVSVSAAAPLLVLGSDIDQLARLGLIRRYLKAYEQYWPGSVSLVIPSSNPDLKYLSTNHLGLVVCIPDEPDLVRLLSHSGPLALYSIESKLGNLAGVLDQLKDQVDVYIDGGDLASKQPPTVLRVVDDAVEIIRPGAIDIRDK